MTLATCFTTTLLSHGRIYRSLTALLLTPDQQAVNINPFCTTFPLEVSCSVPNVGAAGGGQYHNGLCVLSQNIINEKMYIAVWFWTVLLIFIIPLIVIYRILTLTFKCFRSGLLMSK